MLIICYKILHILKYCNLILTLYFVSVPSSRKNSSSTSLTHFTS